jgi:hypothetical protein
LHGRTVFEIRLSPETEAELRGSFTEADLESMRKAAPVRALAGLHLLPSLAECETVQIEQPIVIDSQRLAPELEPLTFRGFIDLSYRRGGYWYFQDHKTTKGRVRRQGNLPADPWAYVKSAEQLQSDPQGILYSLDRMHRFDVPSIWGRWAYMLTDPKRHPAAKPIDCLFTIEGMEPAGRVLMYRADEMRRMIRARIDPNEIDPPENTSPMDPASPCSEFGGCPYRAETGGPCRVSGAFDLGAFLLAPEGNQMTDPLDAAIAATQAAAGAPPAQAPVQPPAAQPPAQPPQAPPAGPPHQPPAGWVYDAHGRLMPAGQAPQASALPSEDEAWRAVSDSAPMPAAPPTAPAPAAPAPAPAAPAPAAPAEGGKKKRRGRPKAEASPPAVHETVVKIEDETLITVTREGKSIQVRVTDPQMEAALVAYVQKEIASL